MKYVQLVTAQGINREKPLKITGKHAIINCI